MDEIVHICTCYSRQKLWRELALSLESWIPSAQLWFVPVRTDWEVGFYPITSSRIQVNYKRLLRPYHKVLYFLKIWQTFNWIRPELTTKRERIIHAHFLFTDGGVALLLSLLKKTRFVVSVRNTDIHGYFKYAKHLKWYGRLILLRADKIVLISPSYREKLVDAVGDRFYQRISSKVVIIPNKLNEKWFSAEKHEEPLNTVRLLYVGDNTANKRFPLILDILNELPENYVATFVGIESNDLDVPAELNERVRVEGKIFDFDKLCEVYKRSHILILPSARETFGMVAAEALAQGRPVLISEGEGISGYIQERLRVSCVNFLDLPEVLVRIKTIVAHYDEYSALAESAAQQFREGNVMNQYITLYGGASHKAKS